LIKWTTPESEAADAHVSLRSDSVIRGHGGRKLTPQRRLVDIVTIESVDRATPQ
jgi:hypothetical protein